MQHGERERSLQVEVARLQRELEQTRKDRDSWLTKYQERFREMDTALAAARRECEVREKTLRALTYAWRSRAMATEDGGDKEAATLLYGCAAEVDAALAAPAAAAGEEGK